jgi:hypothetical protein
MTRNAPVFFKAQALIWPGDRRNKRARREPKIAHG